MEGREKKMGWGWWSSNIARPWMGGILILSLSLSCITRRSYEVSCRLFGVALALCWRCQQQRRESMAQQENVGRESVAQQERERGTGECGTARERGTGEVMNNTDLLRMGI